MADDRKSKLLITFVVFLMLLNYPLLTLVDRNELWLGFPALYMYFFLVWGGMIGVVAFIVRRKRS